MNNLESGPSGIESKEQLKIPDAITIYVFRHGRCLGWETDKWKENGGIWVPDMIDLAEDGIEKVEKSADIASRLVDPEKQIAVMLSSPRARTMTTSSIVAEALKNRGMEFVHDFGKFQPTEMVQFLRSSGDFSNKYNPVSERDQPDDVQLASVSKEVRNQRLEGNTGWRMLEFLNYCATFFPEYYKQKPTFDYYQGKEPVLFLATHNEVVADMLEKLNIVAHPEDKWGTLPPGDFFELTCDLKNPGHFTVSFPDPDYQHPSAEVYINLKTGEATSDKDGFLGFNTKTQEKIEDKTARGGQNYL